MEYKLVSRVPATITVELIQISDCIECGTPVLQKNVSEYEDEYGFISTIRCSNCNNLTKTQTTIQPCIQEWNSKNNFVSVIESKTNQISELKEEIIKLKGLQKSRAKGKK